MRRQRYRQTQKWKKWGLGGLLILILAGWGISSGRSGQTHRGLAALRQDRASAELERKQTKVDAWLKEGHFVGTALVIQKQKVILLNGYGYAVKETGQKNNALSLFNIGSVQKGMTAVLLMHYLERQGLSLEIPLSRFYPDIPGSSQITLKMMANMSSGLSMKTLPENVTNEQEVLAYNEEHVVFKPKKLGHFDYQPVNFVLLAGVIRQLSGLTYQQAFVRFYQEEKGLKGVQYFPLQFSNTQAFTETYLGRKEGQALNYQQPHREKNNHLMRELGTGNVFFSVMGLYQYLGAVIHHHYLTPAATQELLIKTDNYPYTAGLYQNTQNWWIHGVEEGYQTWGYFTADNQTSVLLLSNAGQKSDGPLAKKIFNEINLAKS